MPSMAGKIWTVTGPIEPSQASFTLMHEHVFINLSWFASIPEEASQSGFAYEPMRMDLIGRIHSTYSTNLDNFSLKDEELGAYELLLYKYEGGCSLVDSTSIGLGRDPLGLRVARRTGLNIIAGSGYYVHASHPKDMASKTVEDIKVEIIRDVTIGIPASTVAP